MEENLTAKLNDCTRELQKIKSIIGANKFDDIAKYLQQYAIIKACGTIETVVKNMIADHVERGVNEEVRNYISSKVRASSANPSIGRISQLLGEFSKEVWLKNFNGKLSHHQKEISSLKSLVDLRNSFAHGQNTDATIDNIIVYFEDSQSIITLIEETMNGS